MARLAARAHAFHRFAHHPLCASYAPEILRIGRRGHVCAGCTWAAFGSALGLILGMASPRAWVAFPWALSLQALGLVWLLAASRYHAQTYKWLLRAGPMLPLAWGLLHIARAVVTQPTPPWVFGTQGVLGLIGWMALRIYRRRKPWRVPCATCPQRTVAVCDGFRRMVLRERALHRVSGMLVQRQTAVPSARQPR